MLRRGWTLISSHFLNALADGSREDVAFPVSSHRQGRAAGGLCRLRSLAVKVTLGVGSHPLPSLAGEAGSELSILGVLPPWLLISHWDPSGTGHRYKPSLQKHLLVLNKGRGELLGGFTQGPLRLEGD